MFNEEQTLYTKEQLIDFGYALLNKIHSKKYSTIGKVLDSMENFGTRYIISIVPFVEKDSDYILSNSVDKDNPMPIFPPDNTPDRSAVIKDATRIQEELSKKFFENKLPEEINLLNIVTEC